MEHKRKSETESYLMSEKVIKLENVEIKDEYDISISALADLKSEESDPGSHDDSEVTEWPEVWNAAMWEEKKRSYPWIMCGAGKIGCSSCFNSRKLGLSHATSKEWSSMMVSYYGQSRSARLGSLRKKIFDHAKTHAHLKAEKLLQNAKAQSLKKAVNILNNSDLEGLQIIFRTAYYSIKHGSVDYEQFESLLQLQSLNGLNIPYHLFSQLNFTSIVDHLASEMKSSFFQNIIQNNRKICLIIDEFTRFNSNLVVMLYLKYIVEDESQLIFLDLIEVEDRTPESIVKSILDCLNGHGFDHDYLLDNLVCFSSDGANKTLGQHSSVVKVLSDTYANFLYWQCLNHRIKESLSDNIVKMHGVNHFQLFIQNVYELYELSLKNQCEIQGIALEIEDHFKKYGKISEIGGVVNHLNVVQCIWNNYSSFYSLFNSSSTDQNRSFHERNKYKWLYEQMSSKQFVVNLALMYDILCELTILSDSLQKKNIGLNYANKLINRTVVILTTMKDVKTKKKFRS